VGVGDDDRIAAKRGARGCDVAEQASGQHDATRVHHVADERRITTQCESP
jgi:hypothetical protein